MNERFENCGHLLLESIDQDGSMQVDGNAALDHIENGNQAGEEMEMRRRVSTAHGRAGIEPANQLMEHCLMFRGKMMDDIVSQQVTWLGYVKLA